MTNFFTLNPLSSVFVCKPAYELPWICPLDLESPALLLSMSSTPLQRFSLQSRSLTPLDYVFKDIKLFESSALPHCLSSGVLHCPFGQVVYAIPVLVEHFPSNEFLHTVTVTAPSWIWMSSSMSCAINSFTCTSHNQFHQHCLNITKLCATLDLDSNCTSFGNSVNTSSDSGLSRSPTCLDIDRNGLARQCLDEDLRATTQTRTTHR